MKRCSTGTAATSADSSRWSAGVLQQVAGDGLPDVLGRYDHDDAMLLGTVAGGTLQRRIDGTGLDYQVELPHSRQDVYELVERGDIRHSTFIVRVPCV